MTPIRRPTWPLIVALGSITGLAPTASAQAEPQLSTEIRAGLQPFIDAGQISGAVTLVGTPDGVPSLLALGKREVENDLPMETGTIFRIASMTKPITAVALMMLVDEGKLAIDDPVEKHLPEFRDQMLNWLKQGDAQITRRPPRPITLRDLLTHTSGLPDASPTDSFGREDVKPPSTLAESSRIYGRRPLSFEPGTRWSYSNSGINTLGRVIEVASGMPFEDFLEARIFGPVGMPDTTFYPTPAQVRRLAVVYRLEDGRLGPVEGMRTAPIRGERPPSPAGGLFSTASDLAKLYRMMMHRGAHGGRRLLSESAVERMTRLQTGEIKCGFVDGMGFGLGWGFVKEPQGVTEALSPGTYGHGGAYGTQAWVDPRKGRFAILMIQRSGLANSDASPMRREFQKVAFPSTTP